MRVKSAVVWWVPKGDCGVVLNTPEGKRTIPKGALWMPLNYGHVKFPLLALFVQFNTMVVRDGVDPLTAHRALLRVDAYRKTISPDMEGAE